MVQTYQSPVRIYKHPFELVMAAYEKRFPTCPEIPIFVGSEIISEEKTPDGAEHNVDRKCQLNVDAPYILKKLMGVDYIYFSQKNALNWRNRTLHIVATNITFSTRVVVEETCDYYVHPENSDWTCFEQSASLDVKSFFGFESTVEKIAVKHYASNIQKGKEILEGHIQKLQDSGFKSVPRFPPVQRRSISGRGGDVVAASGPLPVRASSSSDQRGSTPDSAVCELAQNSTVEEESNGSRTEEDEHLVTARRVSVPVIRSRANTADRSATMPPLGHDEADFKLEAEYIQRYLGPLSPLQESRLCELQTSIHRSHKGKAPCDAHILRFLRARDFDVARAREMLVQSIQWRKQHNVDKILSTYKPPPVVVQFFPGSWHHHDLEGRPVFLLRLGQLDIKGVLRSVGEDAILKFVLWVCEEGLKKCEEQTRVVGQPISTWTLLVDLEGLSMRHLWRPGVKVIVRIIEIVEANYPETMGSALVVRAPRVFPVIWTLIAPLINENTREKIMIYGGNDYTTGAGGLRDYIAEKYIPDFLNGPAYTNAPEGGLVPKGCYITEENEDLPAEDNASTHVLDSLYRNAHVYRGLPHEVLIPIRTKGCVITWDFDIVKGEMDFVLLRTRSDRPLHVDEVIATHSPSATLSPTGLVAAHLTGPTDVAFDRSLRLGVDLVKELSEVRCHEGDSIQGSHYCSHTGTYVLQWKSTEHGSGQHGAGTFDFSLPSLHKSKLMYYYEVLDSAQFRGSMMSLESCQSSFSSLSLGGTSSTPSNQRREDHRGDHWHHRKRSQEGTCEP